MQAIYTIGHSTQSIEVFIEALRAYGIQKIVDVRTIAKSRYNPQFGEDQLSPSLQQASLGYQHLEILGGLRPTSKNSINTAWRNKSFRGFADYMQTPKFWEGITELEKIARKHRVAIMCAEAVPWRCHRSLIADTLLVRNWCVLNIMDKKTATPHSMTPFAKVENGRIYYPA